MTIGDSRRDGFSAGGGGGWLKIRTAKITARDMQNCISQRPSTEPQKPDTHRNNIRFLPLQVLLQPRNLQGNLDQPFKSLGSLLPILTLILRIPLNVHANGSALAPSPAQPENHSRAIGEEDDVTLVTRDTVVNRVGVGEVG